MQTSMVFGNQRKLGLLFRERFTSEENVSLTVDGIVNTDNCTLQGRGTVFKRFEVGSGPMSHVLDMVDIGGAYSTDSDEFLATARARKAWTFGKGNRTGSLKLGGEAEINPAQKVDARGRVEVSTKLMNFTDQQDLKLKLGYGHKRIGVSNQFIKGPYGCVRENNWSLMTDFKDFVEVKYDL
eukprot:jgi/Tetstr1/422264/TSEL_013109.t1